MYLNRRHHSQTGFTLIELLVVIGIVVLLGGLLLTGVAKSYKAGIRARQSADLTLIGTALEAYKADFGDYPRFATAADDANGAATDGRWLDYQQDRGAILLCRALLGPGPQSGAGGVAVAGQDGFTGNGFRTRPGGAGTVYGPYIQSDKFTIGIYGTPTATLDTQYYTNAMILDRFGKPILYFPATLSPSPITTNNGFVITWDPQSAPATPYPLYNAFDNAGYSATGPTYLKVADFQKIMGDNNVTLGNNGQIDLTASPPEVATTTQAYLLWSAGPDGNYGLDSTGKTDDITNFDIPPNLRK